MNKELLYDKIMSGISKTLHESFSQWKDANIPKFDEDLFKVCLEKFFRVLNELLKVGEIRCVSYSWVTESDNKVKLYTTLKETDQTFNLNADRVLTIVDNAHIQMAENFAEQMRKTYICITVDNKRYLDKYIADSINYNRNSITDYEFIRVGTGADECYKLTVTADNIMSHVQDLIEFFS